MTNSVSKGHSSVTIPTSLDKIRLSPSPTTADGRLMTNSPPVSKGHSLVTSQRHETRGLLAPMNETRRATSLSVAKSRPVKGHIWASTS
jgi:hypothetical protein